MSPTLRTAWESLEALLTGYLYAGNRDLLDATRVAYPGSSSPPDNRALPKEEPTPFAGTSQMQISYARLYFLQAIKDVLEYMAEDTTGALRAGSSIFPTVPHYVTFDEQQSQILPFPRFDDPNFGSTNVQNREPSQSVAYLHGSAMERLSLSAVSYADQLWRSAYAGPDAGFKRPQPEKDAMLQRATDALKENIHAEFLASLPLAAQPYGQADRSSPGDEMIQRYLEKETMKLASRFDGDAGGSRRCCQSHGPRSPAVERPRAPLVPPRA